LFSFRLLGHMLLFGSCPGGAMSPGRQCL
jgi:hypothetical protein